MPLDILHFWFDEIRPAQWWTKDAAFDALIAARFSELHARAARCELHDWRGTAEGRLAEIIVLDQFPRNMFRGSAAAFASDPLALALSQEAVVAGADRLMTPTQKVFLYMPHMHSESLPIHKAGIGLFEHCGVKESFDSALRHKRVIERFGRYPHRNAVLGRASTEAELAFLREPGSTF